MKQMNNNNQIEEKAAKLWQTNVNTDEFWASYTQLLQEAQRKRNTPTAFVLAETQPPKLVGTTADHAHLPWVKLMVPHWDEFPLKVGYQQLGDLNKAESLVFCLSPIFVIAFIIAVLTAFIKFSESFETMSMFGRFVSLIALVGVTLLILLGLFNKKTKSQDSEPPIEHLIYEFQADFILYEKRIVYSDLNKPDKKIFVKIPYGSIGYISHENYGVTIRPFTREEWTDQYNKNFAYFWFSEDHHQIISFLKDVIKANYSNRANTP